MRITNSMMITNSMWNINNNMKRLNKAQEEMSTQSKIQLPSDDPVVATRAIKYRNYVANVEQYQKNTDDATSWMQVTEGALNNLTDVIHRAQELAVQGANGTLANQDKHSIAQEIGQLKDSVVEIMNTSYAGRYVFGGFSSDQPPYKIQSTAVGDKVMFKGQYLSLGGPVPNSVVDSDVSNFCTSNAGQMYQSTGAQAIQYNIGLGNQIAVNLEGQDVIGQAVEENLFDTLDCFLLGLNGETSYKTAQITTSPVAITVENNNLDFSKVIADLSNDLNRVLTARTDLGARTNYVSRAQNGLSNDNITYTKLMSNNEDVDVALASSKVSSAEYVYEASLSTGAKVMNKSLLDYLK